jgi:serine protease Do
VKEAHVNIRFLPTVLLGLSLLSPLAAQEASDQAMVRLSPQALAHIRACCFEVVIEKPVKDSLTYETPLNRDLEDYSVRTDPYFPVGTAFAINAAEAVTAAHVFDLMPGSLVNQKLFIRDRQPDGAKGQVWEVEDITALGEHRDYIVFTVKGKRFDTWLKVNPSFELNSPVFTAGDAYGEGIVVRDGTLLDETPEEEDGIFKNLKSSAAVNPGNSGGPLLNRDGEAIGIVQSHRADFCYSLPLREITPGRAFLHRRMACTLGVMKKQKRETVDADWALPMGYRAFAERYAEYYWGRYRALMDALREENRGGLFPAGDGSGEALFESVGGSFPQMYVQDPVSRRWHLTGLAPRRTDISGNGFLAGGSIDDGLDAALMELKKPDGMSVTELWESPKRLMDLLLEGMDIRRTISSGDIGSRVLSFGQPARGTTFTDRWGRNWKLSVFLQEYRDDAFITCATPTPRGVSLLCTACPSSETEMWLYDMPMLADFVNTCYLGTLAEWEAFPARVAFASGPLRGITVSRKDGAWVDVDAGSVATRVREGLVHVTGETELLVDCGVYAKDGVPGWGVRRIRVSTGAGIDNDFFSLYRWTKPAASLPDRMKNQWKSTLLGQRHPFNGSAYPDAGSTSLGMLHPDFVHKGKVTMPGDYLFTLFASREGVVPEARMKSWIQAFARETRIRE